MLMDSHRQMVPHVTSPSIGALVADTNQHTPSRTNMTAGAYISTKSPLWVHYIENLPAKKAEVFNRSLTV